MNHWSQGGIGSMAFKKKKVESVFQCIIRQNVKCNEIVTWPYKIYKKKRISVIDFIKFLKKKC